MSGGLPGTLCVVLEPAGAFDAPPPGHGVPAGWDVDEESPVHVLQLVFSVNFFWILKAIPLVARGLFWAIVELISSVHCPIYLVIELISFSS